MKRTALQCQARGCDGCIVCEPEKYTEAERLVYSNLSDAYQKKLERYDEKLKPSCVNGSGADEPKGAIALIDEEMISEDA